MIYDTIDRSHYITHSFPTLIFQLLQFPNQHAARHIQSHSTATATATHTAVVIRGRRRRQTAGFLLTERGAATGLADLLHEGGVRSLGYIDM